MSFQVIVLQTPFGHSAMLTRTELSTDTLQLKLIKDIHNVVSINGHKLTLAQKETLRTLGTRWEVTDLEGQESGSVLVTARREGFMRTWTVDPMGVGRFADGHGAVMPMSLQDPLNSSPWGDGLTEA
jgi:hypothetical protein